jgi:hypothetical protein
MVFFRQATIIHLTKKFPTLCKYRRLKFRFVFWDVLPCKIIDSDSEVRAASIIRAIIAVLQLEQQQI